MIRLPLTTYSYITHLYCQNITHYSEHFAKLFEVVIPPRQALPISKNTPMCFGWFGCSCKYYHLILSTLSRLPPGKSTSWSARKHVLVKGCCGWDGVQATSRGLAIGNTFHLIYGL